MQNRDQFWNAENVDIRLIIAPVLVHINAQIVEQFSVILEHGYNIIIRIKKSRNKEKKMTEKEDRLWETQYNVDDPAEAKLAHSAELMQTVPMEDY